MPLPTLQNAYHGPIVTLAFAGDGSLPKYIQSVPVSQGNIRSTSFYSEFLLNNQSNSSIGNLFAFLGLNSFRLHLDQAQLATLYEMSITPLQVQSLTFTEGPAGTKNYQWDITISTIYQNRCRPDQEDITYQYRFVSSTNPREFTDPRFSSNLIPVLAAVEKQDIFFTYVDPSSLILPGGACTPSVVQRPVSARLVFLNVSEDEQEIAIFFDVLDPALRTNNPVFFEQVLVPGAFTSGTVLSKYFVPATTIGVLTTTLQRRSGLPVYSPRTLPLMVSGSFNSDRTISIPGNLMNQDIIQIRSEKNWDRGNFLCYTDRGRDNTPWMSSQGNKTTDPNTYWRIYALNDDGTVSCDRTKKIQTNKPVAFQSLACTSPDKCFSCSFISSQGPKKGGEGEAPSMEGKTIAGVCERWYLKLCNPPQTLQTNSDNKDVPYGTILVITTEGAQPRKGCKNAGKALKVSCDVNKQDVCMKDIDTIIRLDVTDFQWSLVRVAEVDYSPYNTCPCPP